MEAMEGLCITNTKSKTHNFLLKALVSILVLKGRGQDQEQLKIYSFFFFFPQTSEILVLSLLGTDTTPCIWWFKNH